MLRLRDVRKKLGLSQWEVAKRAGIHPSNYSRIERGIFPAYKGWRERIARALHWPLDRVDELFEKIEE